uniref:Uncharacterized protein n=1 Tax=Aegilops tauschii subsp. strangulata TaxID=200361 RepID=A0A453KGW0_AEGTS
MEKGHFFFFVCNKTPSFISPVLPRYFNFCTWDLRSEERVAECYVPLLDLFHHGSGYKVFGRNWERELVLEREMGFESGRKGRNEYNRLEHLQ